MSIPNWTEMTFYHYLAIGGGVLVLLALVLFFTRLSRLQVPAILMGIIGGFGAGAALGVVGMGFYGYRLQPEGGNEVVQEMGAPGGGGPPGMMGAPGGGGPPGMMGGRGMMGGMMGGGRRGPSPKTQLATLVAKLDSLTNKPLRVNLDDKQKDKVREQLKDLEAKKELSDDDAKGRLDALLAILKDQRQTLEDAGYRWPGGGGGGGARQAANNPNPFQEEANGKHLKALRDRLAQVQN